MSESRASWSILVPEVGGPCVTSIAAYVSLRENKKDTKIPLLNGLDTKQYGYRIPVDIGIPGQKREGPDAEAPGPFILIATSIIRNGA